MNTTAPASGPVSAERKPRVAVVFGGRSSEHAISCVTAAGVLRAIDRDRYDVVPVGITTTGRWVLVPDDPAALEISAGRLPQVPGDGATVVLAPQSVESHDLVLLEPGRAPGLLGEVDVVFPLLHGPYGEDGTVQGMLELSDTRYVGSGVVSSAMSMDKQYMKIVLAGSGLPIGPYVVITPAEWRRDPAACEDAVAALGWPVFVKPARGGSSIGVSKVDAPDALATAIAAAQEYDPKVVVEAAVVGREIECGVIESPDGGAPATSLPCEIEVIAGHDFYDFDAKYLDEASLALRCPADLPEQVTERVQSIAARTFEVMGCEGLARVDMFVQTDGRVIVNELNTMPGFTPLSVFPLVWERSGVAYPELIDRLLQLALKRRTGLR